ncbi:MAG: HAD family phosphatase [Bacteroidales bacterium]|nr:HAD family phosphatase [Bacteroidales bacterium]
MKTTKAVIFDMGGVLVDLDVEDCKNAFKSLLGYYAIDELIDPCHQKGIYGDLEEGTMSAEDFRKAVLAESNPGSDPRLVDEAMWHILVGIEPYKAELLRKLSESYDLYLLSNNNPICIPHSRKMFEDAGASLDKYFKKCFLSYEMKALKPSDAFYKAVMEQIGLPADQMLFIDDSQKNVDGALAVGLPAVFYQPGSDLSALLADVLDNPGLKMEDVH